MGTGRDFFEKTKYRHLGMSDQMRGVPPPPVQLPSDGEDQPFSLPDPAEFAPPRDGLRNAIESRRSIRDFSGEPITVDELSYLLHCTQGVREIVSGFTTLRTVPSAGARHALETYLLVNRVDPLEPGLYRYMAVEHALFRKRGKPRPADGLVDACLGQDMVKTAAVAFIWTAVPYRMSWRYGERGYRYLLIDAGHVCQNLYLCAESIGCGACAIAAFDDDLLDSLLGIDGERQFAIYLAVVGRKGPDGGE